MTLSFVNPRDQPRGLPKLNAIPMFKKLRLTYRVAVVKGFDEVRNVLHAPKGV